MSKSITHEDALSLIASDANTLRIFKSFPKAAQEKLISFIQGNQGLQIMHAWLTFFGSDSSADIVKLVNSCPEFLSCYRDITEFRRHPKELITMFSEVLAIMDHNTELYMIDEMRKESDELRNHITEMSNTIAEKDNTIALAINLLRNQGKSMMKSKGRLD